MKRKKGVGEGNLESLAKMSSGSKGVKFGDQEDESPFISLKGSPFRKR